MAVGLFLGCVGYQSVVHRDRLRGLYIGFLAAILWLAFFRIVKHWRNKELTTRRGRRRAGRQPQVGHECLGERNNTINDGNKPDEGRPTDTVIPPKERRTQFDTTRNITEQAALAEIARKDGDLTSRLHAFAWLTAENQQGEAFAELRQALDVRDEITRLRGSDRRIFELKKLGMSLSPSHAAYDLVLAEVRKMAEDLRKTNEREYHDTFAIGPMSDQSAFDVLERLESRKKEARRRAAPRPLQGHLPPARDTIDR